MDYDREPCKSGWTDQDADSHGPKEPCITCCRTSAPWWIDLCSGGDAGCRYRYCSNLLFLWQFSAVVRFAHVLPQVTTYSLVHLASWRLATLARPSTWWMEWFAAICGALYSTCRPRSVSRYCLLLCFYCKLLLPSVLWRCWLGCRKGIRPVKTERSGAGMGICLEWDADLRMAQWIPLPLTVSCFSKIQIGFTFLVPAHPGSPRQRAVKQVCVVVSK